MARPSSKDPLDRFRWSISIEGFTRMGFTSCDVPSYAITTKKYAEGGAHLFPRQIVDSIEYRPVTLARGVTADTSFNDWAMQFIEVIQAETVKSTQNTLSETKALEIPPEFGVPGFSGGNFTVPGFNVTTFETSETFEGTPAQEYRRDVTINHLNRSGQIVKTYRLYNAFPVEYVPASSFSADGDDVLSMEKLTLVYESFDVVSNNKDSNPFDVRGAFKRLVKRF